MLRSLPRKQRAPRNLPAVRPFPAELQPLGGNMNSIVYLVGLVVIVIAILSLIGLR
jgi:hypothetical protein